MLFSIIVPIYNVEKYLEKCLSSIQNQLYRDFECILVDDGSTDNSAKICDLYVKKDRRFRVTHKLNGGIVSARQTGAELASGEYVVCIDGDDWIQDNYLLQFASVIDKYNPDIVCCGAKWYYTQEHIEDRILNIEEGFYSKRRIEEEIYPFLIHDEYGKYFPPSLWAKAFRRKIYLPQQLSVNKNIKIGEDMSCTYACVYLSHSLYCMKECLYFYRQNEQSMTHKKVFDVQGPKMIGEQLHNAIKSSKYDFDNQINRLVVHLLFNCCKTQFYGKGAYKDICNTIEEVLSIPYYKEMIKKCTYSVKYMPGKLALIAMKYRLFMLIKIYSIIK